MKKIKKYTEIFREQILEDKLEIVQFPEVFSFLNDFSEDDLHIL